MFNKKQIKALKVAEPFFTTAVRSGYKRATSSTLNDMVADYYDSVSGRNPISRNWSCNTCVFNLYKMCGKIYFDSIKQVETKNEPALETNELNNTDTDK